MIELNNEATEVNLGGYVLKLKQNIDYKPTGEQKLTVGRIDKFTTAPPPDTDSIWMYITELEDSRHTECISIAVWKSQYESGFFSHKPVTTNLINDNTQPEDDDLPF